MIAMANRQIKKEECLSPLLAFLCHERSLPIGQTCYPIRKQPGVREDSCKFDSRIYLDKTYQSKRLRCWCPA